MTPTYSLKEAVQLIYQMEDLFELNILGCVLIEEKSRYKPKEFEAIQTVFEDHFRTFTHPVA